MTYAGISPAVVVGVVEERETQVVQAEWEEG